MRNVSDAPSPTMLLFIDGVNELMARRGVSKSELSRRTNIDVAALRRTLNGRGGSCQFSTADKIADALGTSTFDLIEAGKNTPKVSKAS
ncbi:helix-turn-helix transcriptional regulator [Roseiconus lacunae]|uniref:helix-turn-helix domain-containing protein n=1 Tax=Roseiconus lacunae TaxID=2605694 RepID=UPI00308AD28F|nr:helix-turn-helix transcriptional regulator [Stieleria sp. HD01]